MSPLPPSNVESTENDLNARLQHCIGGEGEGGNTSFLRVYCLYVPRVLARVVVQIKEKEQEALVKVFYLDEDHNKSDSEADASGWQG